MDVLAASRWSGERRAGLEQRPKRGMPALSGRFIRPIAALDSSPAQQQDVNAKRGIRPTEGEGGRSLSNVLKVPAERIRIATGDHDDDWGTKTCSKPECKVELHHLTVGEACARGGIAPSRMYSDRWETWRRKRRWNNCWGACCGCREATPTGIAELDPRLCDCANGEDVARRQPAEPGRQHGEAACGFDRGNGGMTCFPRVHSPPRWKGNRSCPLSSIPVSAPPDLSSAPLFSRTIAGQGASTNRTSGTIIRFDQPLTRDDAQSCCGMLVAGGRGCKTAVENYWQEEREVGTAPKQLDPVPLSRSGFRNSPAVRDGQRLAAVSTRLSWTNSRWNLNRCDPKFTRQAEFSDELHVGDHVVLDVTGQGAVRVGGVEEVIVRQAIAFAG